MNRGAIPFRPSSWQYHLTLRSPMQRHGPSDTSPSSGSPRTDAGRTAPESPLRLLLQHESDAGLPLSWLSHNSLSGKCQVSGTARWTLASTDQSPPASRVRSRLLSLFFEQLNLMPYCLICLTSLLSSPLMKRCFHSATRLGILSLSPLLSSSP